MAILMRDGIKLKRVSWSAGFFGYEKGKVYTFEKHPQNPLKYRTQVDGAYFLSVSPTVSELDWEFVPENTTTVEPDPTSIFIVVSNEPEGKAYGVFYEEQKAVAYIAEKNNTDVYRFFENGSTEPVTPTFISGKIRLLTTTTEEETDNEF